MDISPFFFDVYLNRVMLGYSIAERFTDTWSIINPNDTLFILKVS